MKHTNLYLAVAWLASVGVAYAIGWWSGVKGATSVAVGTAKAGYPIAIGALALVAVGAAVAAFRVRGMLSGGSTNDVQEQNRL